MQTAPSDVHFTCHCSNVKFKTQNHFPQSRCKHVCCLHDECVYLYGGKDGPQSLKDFWRFNVGTLSWEALCYRGDKPPHLEGHTLVSYKKLLLLLGGEFGDSMTECSLWIINPDLQYIRKAMIDVGAERPCARRNHSAVVYEGCMYVYGGYIDLKGSSSELWRYHVEDEEWELVSSGQQVNRGGPGSRHGHTAVVYNKCMWLFGGQSDLVTKQEFWRFRFGSRKWERIKYKHGPPPLSGHTAILVQHQMVLFGGEVNREPVSQLWSYNFKTDRWLQINIGNEIPAGVTFHSMVLVSGQPKTDSTVKANSMPYLQHKLKRLTMERPKSSPVYSSTCPDSNAHSQTRTSESRSQAREIGSRSSDPPQVLNLRNNSASEESLKVISSPAENSKDNSPLIPEQMDMNYNALSVIDKNVVENGIDNPGISKSTEELIRENQVIRLYRTGAGSLSGTGTAGYQQWDELSMSDRKQYRRQILRQNSEGISVTFAKDGTCSINGDPFNHNDVKRTRLDPDLVIEDLEDQDCFPQKVEVPLPRSRSLYMTFDSTFSLDNPTSESVETITLNDLGVNSRGRSRSTSDMMVDGAMTNLNSNAGTGNASSWSVHGSESDITRQRLPSDSTRSWQVGEECETSFQCVPVARATSQTREGRYRKHRHDQTNKPSPPYILVFGGKEKNGVSFQIKPIVIRKFLLKNL